MVWMCLLLVGVAFAVSMPVTSLMIRLGHRYRALDSGGVPGQVKAARRAVPNTGGVGIFTGVVLPVIAGLAAVHLMSDEAIARAAPSVAAHLAGIRRETALALTLLGCLAALHVMGLVDDRRPMGPWLKLGVMVVAAGVMATVGGTRLLTMLDSRVGGAWLSVAVTVLWIVVVTNAMNFMDNMDGLSGGAGAIAAACFLAAALASPQPQWFVGACFALLVGSLLGFLVFNFPPAKVFMGDGGSLVIGFLLAFLSIRLTYLGVASPSTTPIADLSPGTMLPVPPLRDARAVAAAAAPSNWYAVLTPLIVLAIPLYDFVSVVVIRLSQGRSPFVGDLQHFSHRLVRKGLSKRAAVLVIYGFTACTGISGIAMGSLRPWQAVLVGVQTIVLLSVLAVFEWRSSASVPDEGERA